MMVVVSRDVCISSSFEPSNSSSTSENWGVVKGRDDGFKSGAMGNGDAFDTGFMSGAINEVGSGAEGGCHK